MSRAVVIDGLLSGPDLWQADHAWPEAAWPGWVHYDSPTQRKHASDRATSLPPALAVLLVRLASLGLGGLLGLPQSTADLSLHGAGLHALPPGPGLPEHLDADTHARLGLLRAWSAALYVHCRWEHDWGGELVLRDSPDRVIMPQPGRLVVFDARSCRHLVRPVTCPAGVERRSLALFGYLPLPGPGRRPRADFGPS